MSESDIDRLADGATEGLRDDRELRLDVRQELVSHIEESIADCREGGMGQEQSVAEGVKAFGPAIEIAAELVSANRARMRVRQRVRLAIRALLVPASLLVAVWIHSETLATSRMVRSMSDFDGGSHDDGYTKELLCPGGMTEETAFLFFGDTSLETGSERQRSIWERYPTNRLFYGNYITELTSERQLKDMDDLRFFEQEIRKGEELDPENARYNYLLAGMMMEIASEWDYRASDDGGEEERVLIVRDRPLLDRAMAEVLKGGEKPFADTYLMQMQALRFAELPRESSMAECIARAGYAAGMPLPDVLRYTNVGRTSSEYAQLLIGEGKKKEAIPYLEAWSPLAEKMLATGGALIETLAAFAIAGTSSNNVAILEEIGEAERAAAMSSRSEALVAVSREYRAGIRAENNDLDELVSRHGGIMQALLLPSLGGMSLSKEDLAPLWYLEQTVIERGWLSLFVASLLAAMLGLFVVSLCLRFTRGGESAPLLLLPDAARMLRVIACSVLIPLAVFFIYTRHTDLAGRDLSMRMWPRFVIELHLLTVVMLSVAAYRMQKLVDVRCRQLGLESPGKRNYSVMFLVCFIPLGVIVWAAAGRRRSAMFRGTVARSLIPVLALIIVLVGTLAHPYLLNREKRFVRADVILAMPEGGGFTQMETHLVERLNRDALKALADADREYGRGVQE